MIVKKRRRVEKSLTSGLNSIEYPIIDLAGPYAQVNIVVSALKK